MTCWYSTHLRSLYLPLFPTRNPLDGSRLRWTCHPRLCASHATERPRRAVARRYLRRQVADKPNHRPHQNCHLVDGALRVAPDGPHLIPVQLGSLGEPRHVTVDTICRPPIAVRWIPRLSHSLTHIFFAIPRNCTGQPRSLPDWSVSAGRSLGGRAVAKIRRSARESSATRWDRGGHPRRMPNLIGETNDVCGG